MRMMNVAMTAMTAVTLAMGCENPPTEAEPSAEEKALTGVKAYIADGLADLHAQSQALCAAAPSADADGWNATDDADDVAAMKEAWKGARKAYERIEGAIAVLFPELDAATDERYDGFIAEGADDDLFDGEGVIGVHAIERILYADQIPQHVIDFESGLNGYQPARFPQSEAEANAFKSELCQRLVDDTQAMVDGFAPLALDTETAYRGVIGSIAEQIEKVALAGSGEDESRYAQFTLADMRANLEGGRAIFTQFEELFHEQGEDGETIEHAVLARFDAIDAHYDGIDGDAIPTVPQTWNPDDPSGDDLATPYGALFSFLQAETDVDNDDSLVAHMIAGADLLGIPQLPE